VSEPAATAPLSCPGCDQAMLTARFDAHYGRTVDLDLCHGCGLIWFDQQESIALTPGAVLKLFSTLDEHREQRHPLGSPAMRCPRCRRPLAATVDRQRATLFSYWRCPADEGRLTTFFDFLREKNFVRPLDAREMAELRERVQTLTCSGCGAPVDLAKGSSCAFCRAPLSLIDTKQVESIVRELKDAEANGHRPIPPDLPLRLLRLLRPKHLLFSLALCLNRGMK